MRLGVDAPFLRLAAHQADRALGVLERAGGPARPSTSPGRRGQRYLRMMPVMPIELSQAAISVPSTSQREVVVAAAGADQHRDAGVLLLRGPVDGDRRLGDVGEPLGRLAVDLVRLAVDHQLEELLLADLRGVIPRGLAGPDVDDEGLSAADAGTTAEKAHRKRQYDADSCSIPLFLTL